MPQQPIPSSPSSAVGIGSSGSSSGSGGHASSIPSIRRNHHHNAAKEDHDDEEDVVVTPNASSSLLSLNVFLFRHYHPRSFGFSRHLSHSLILCLRHTLSRLLTAMHLQFSCSSCISYARMRAHTPYPHARMHTALH